jgi:hypothetical protein
MIQFMFEFLPHLFQAGIVTDSLPQVLPQFLKTLPESSVPLQVICWQGQQHL